MRVRNGEQPSKPRRLNEVTDCRQRSLLWDLLLSSEMKSGMTDNGIESMLDRWRDSRKWPKPISARYPHKESQML